MKFICPLCLKEMEVSGMKSCDFCGKISWAYSFEECVSWRTIPKVRFDAEYSSIEVFTDCGFISAYKNVLTIYPAVSKIINKKIILEQNPVYISYKKNLPPWQLIINYIKYKNFR